MSELLLEWININGRKYGVTQEVATAFYNLQSELREAQELLQEAREGLSNEKEHSQFMEKLLAARHGEGWQSLTIDRAKHTRESER